MGGSFIVDWLFELNLKYRGGVKVNCSRAAKKSEIGNLSSKCIANLVCYCEWKRCLLKLGLICRVGNGRTQYSKPNGFLKQNSMQPRGRIAATRVQLVSSLIDADLGQWNKDLIKEVFMPTDVYTFF